VVVWDKLEDDKWHENVNATIISSGVGVVYRRFDFKYKEKFLELEAEAKGIERGIWKIGR